MKKTILFIIVLAVGLLYFKTSLMAREETGSSAKPSVKSLLDEGEAPFQTIWEKQFQFTHTTQQAGQNVNAFSFTSTFILSESGHFVSAALEGSRLKVEGTDANTGTLTLGGGLGLGFFSPALSIGLQGGESALHVISLNLSSDFRFSDSFSGSLSLGGSSGNHQGPLSALFPIPGDLGEVVVEVDTKNANAALGFSYIPLDWLMLSLAVQNEYEITYRIQNLAKTASLSMNQTDQVASVTLGLDFMPFKGWVFGLSPQAGQEYLPAGSVYSPQAGRMVTYSTPTTQNFVAWSTSISFSFE